MAENEKAVNTAKEVRGVPFEKGDDPRRNLAGRPLESLNFKTKWYKMIDKIALQNNLTSEEIDEQLLLIGYRKAKDGDYPFYRDAMDRIHGKPIQPTETKMTGDITINIVKYGDQSAPQIHS